MKLSNTPMNKAAWILKNLAPAIIEKNDPIIEFLLDQAAATKSFAEVKQLVEKLNSF